MCRKFESYRGSQLFKALIFGSGPFFLMPRISRLTVALLEKKMTAKIISGTEIRKEILSEIASEVEQIKQELERLGAP